MAARQTSPVIGDACSSALSLEEQAKENSTSHHFDVTIGYRYQSSYRHFIGTVEQKQRELLHNQIENEYHLMDVAISYDLTPSWQLTGSVPILVADRHQLYPPQGYYHTSGIGDMSVGVRHWLFRPPTESGGNISLGISAKFPTGSSNSRDKALLNGKWILATADQSIQPGDGGFGFALDTQMFHRLPFKTTGYFTGSWLFNPQDTNGVPTFRSKKGEQVMSVTDQYLWRGGLTHGVPKIRGLAGSIGGRMEGVPVRDAFGRSNGFRRPGYAISVEPSVIYAWRRYTFTGSAPVAVERNRKRSVTDIANGTHGDAAFADYAVLLSVSRHF